MSRGVGTLAIAGVAVVAVGLGAWMLTSDTQEDEPAEVRTRDEGKRRGPREAGAAATNEDLEDRVAQLEDEVAQMRRELQKLRMVRGSAAARGATVDADDPEGAAESPVFEGAVRDIIESEREEAREKRTDAMRERFSERHGEILDELVVAAGLDKTERQSIEALWETESEQMIPLFMAAREGERPFSEVREEAEKLRNATDASVEEMLTPAQFEQYQEMRPGPPGRGRRDGGRRGGGPP